MLWAIFASDEGLQPVRFEFVLAECANKEAAHILLLIEIDDEGAFELGFSEDHNQLRRTEWVTSAKPWSRMRVPQNNTTVMTRSAPAR